MLGFRLFGWQCEMLGFRLFGWQCETLGFRLFGWQCETLGFRLLGWQCETLGFRLFGCVIGHRGLGCSDVRTGGGRGISPGVALAGSPHKFRDVGRGVIRVGM